MYLILSTAQTEDQAKAFSALMWSICAPPNRQTIYGPTWLQHPSGTWALNLGSGTWYVHPGADLEPFLEALPVPQAERDDLRDALDAARGSRVTASALVPPAMQGNLRTADQMRAEGWWPININTADTATLQTLSGVSEARADAIIAGRPWSDPADLTSISGISAAMVARWQDDPGLEV